MPRLPRKFSPARSHVRGVRRGIYSPKFPTTSHNTQRFPAAKPSSLLATLSRKRFSVLPSDATAPKCSFKRHFEPALYPLHLGAATKNLTKSCVLHHLVWLKCGLILSLSKHEFFSPSNLCFQRDKSGQVIHHEARNMPTERKYCGSNGFTQKRRGAAPQ